jgi:hypothetical protein
MYIGSDIVRDGLILHLDAGSERSYPKSGTVWKDLSGNSNDGILTNGPTFNSGNGGSIVFDGVNDYVLGSSNLGISGNATFSICYWAMWDGVSFSTNYPSGVGNNTTGSGNTGLSTTWKDGRIALDFWNNRFRAESTLSVKKWYYLCFTKTSGLIGSTTKLYSNSVELVGAVEGTNTTPNITDNPFVVGRLDSTRWFNGKISNVKIYNRAITSEEIKKNYNATRKRFGL